MARSAIFNLVLLAALASCSAHAHANRALRHARKLAQAPSPGGSSVMASCGDDLWSSPSRPGNWTCATLQPGALNLYWRVDGQSLLLGVTAFPAASGVPVDWVGVGVSEAGGMPGADILVLRRTAKSLWLVEDRYATAYATPILDAQQDKKLVSIEESTSGVVRAVARVPLQSCDTKQDRSIFPGAQPVIFAFGTGPFSYHGTVNRGDITLSFIPDGNVTAASNTSNSLAITIPQHEIPSEEADYYYCVDVELPTQTTQHLISFTPIINSTLPDSVGRVVHHAVLYNCTQKPATFGQGIYRCESQPAECATYVLVSAGVPTTQDLPEQAGFRVGPGDMRYATLQIHYSNPTLTSGLKDASGFQVTLTPNLRPHDMGVLALGWEGFDIPGNANSYSMGPAVCPSDCTQRFSAPINVVSTMLHMHKIGVAMDTQHVSSNGTTLRPLAERNLYQFGYQPALTVVADTRVVRPGDTLVTNCKYTNPSDAKVNYGYRSSDEMCYSYNWFWPLEAASGITECLSEGFLTNSLPFCGSSTSKDAFVKFLQASNLTSVASVTAALKTAASKGWLAPVNATEVAASMKPYNNTPATCGL